MVRIAGGRPRMSGCPAVTEATHSETARPPGETRSLAPSYVVGQWQKGHSNTTGILSICKTKEQESEQTV